MRSRTFKSAADIRTVLTDPEWRVRPPGNEVPAGLRGTLAGDVFSHFARMSEGAAHEGRKQRAVDLIDELDLDAIPLITHDVIRRLCPVTPQDLQFLVPGMVVSALLGIPEFHQRSLVEQVRALVVGSRPTASAMDHAAAINGMESAVMVIADSLEPAVRDDIDVIASRVSLIFQASDACAAMVGNALVMLSDDPNPSTANATSIVRDSMHARVPVRLTSRFKDDESAVLDLESAHKQQPNAEWTFGFGLHACPGRSLTVAIGIACIDAVAGSPSFDLSAVRSAGWEDLPNVWIPILSLESEGSR